MIGQQRVYIAKVLHLLHIRDRYSSKTLKLLLLQSLSALFFKTENSGLIHLPTNRFSSENSHPIWVDAGSNRYTSADVIRGF